MNACIYGILNQKKKAQSICDLCEKPVENIINLPIKSKDYHHNTNRIKICVNCFQKLINYQNVIVQFELFPFSKKL